jgi:signal peptidase I
MPMLPENAAETPSVAPVPARPPRWRRVAGAFVDWLRTLSFALVLFVLVRALLVEAFKIPSGSMEGTLLVGDFLLVNKLVYGAEIPLTRKRLPALRAPERGEVVVFSYPKDVEKNYVKRVVGVAGDTIEMRGGALLRNGSFVNEPYVRHTEKGADPSADEFRWQRDFLVKGAHAATPNYHPSRDNWGPIEVPPHNLFVLGDNRDNSEDSRYWGFLPDSLVRGRPLFVYYSYAPDTVSMFDWLTRVRWQRLLTRIE